MSILERIKTHSAKLTESDQKLIAMFIEHRAEAAFLSGPQLAQRANVHGVAAGCLMFGGFLAWLVVLTAVPGRRLLGLAGTLPYMIPSFAAALAWGTLFRNSRLGGSAGFFETNGFAIPDWLA